MSYASRFIPRTDTPEGQQVATRAMLLIGSAVTLSALIIIAFNWTLSRSTLEQIGSGVELAALTLVPYMIAAAVAAITALCVLLMVPAAQLRQPATVIRDRLQALANGDLASRIQGRKPAPHVQELVYELNLATSNLSHQIAQWKVINRQQWELLEAMREITVVDGHRQLVRIIEQMQANWEKIAEIEERLKT
ncbi:MAG TPA: hypothetical protein PLR32_07600 [candidate division Zixibacteria bacterium]|nr:hypothetical protein [candidate division Zixibacteria bacterium]MDD4916992.1 hypothetical protein [candidate division Zixibacteria bacterium]MDM7972617.1 hypothetical protein [candidate division Zixibacteria bacterium]HOD66175.1 hypothetical protein [candidate division Zixibacteria bacterium]HPC10597.1 hypothetical protein [candidate division Zixibacteria bacterium]